MWQVEAECAKKFPPLHSITSSARASTRWGKRKAKCPVRERLVKPAPPSHGNGISSEKPLHDETHDAVASVPQQSQRDYADENPLGLAVIARRPDHRAHADLS